jgi:fructan beta-fructosidase
MTAPSEFQGGVMIRVDSLQDQSLTFELSNENGEKVTASIENNFFTFDRSRSGKTDFHESFPGLHRTPLSGITVQSIEIYIDAASIEIFINDGEVVLTELVFPNASFSKIALTPGVKYCIRKMKQ